MCHARTCSKGHTVRPCCVERAKAPNNGQLTAQATGGGAGVRAPTPTGRRSSALTSSEMLDLRSFAGKPRVALGTARALRRLEAKRSAYDNQNDLFNVANSVRAGRGAGIGGADSSAGQSAHGADPEGRRPSNH